MTRGNSKFKKIILLSGMTVLLFSAAGCGNTARKKDSAQETAQTLSSGGSSEKLSERTLLEKQQETDDTELSGDSDQFIDADEAEQEPLTEIELDFFTQYLNKLQNNTFLQSSYSTPMDMDLNEVLYNGVDSERPPLSDEVMQAYMAEYGDIMTDIVYFTTPELEEFIAMKTGFTLNDFEKQLDWPYLAQYDMYLCQHGDVYYVPVTCISGTKSPGVYEITYEYEDFLSESGVSTGRVVLNQEYGNKHYWFYSNIADLSEEDAAGNEELSFDPSIINSFYVDADISEISGFDKFDDFSSITREKLYGTWYDPHTNEVLVLSEEGAFTYLPSLDLYGTTLYDWELTDRSADGLCPALKIYCFESETSPLAYYVAGVRDEYFWCNSQQQIFYRQ